MLSNLQGVLHTLEKYWTEFSTKHFTQVSPVTIRHKALQQKVITKIRKKWSAGNLRKISCLYERA
jgi:hypothetical protein